MDTVCPAEMRKMFIMIKISYKIIIYRNKKNN